MTLKKAKRPQLKPLVRPYGVQHPVATTLACVWRKEGRRHFICTLTSFAHAAAAPRQSHELCTQSINPTQEGTLAELWQPAHVGLQAC